MSETTKDLVEVVTAGTMVAVAAAAPLAAAAAAAPLAAATLPGLIGVAWQQRQARRVDRWWKLVTEGAADAKQLEDRVLAGLADDDESVVAGVVEGARAATAAVDLAAIPIIAELSRRHFRDRDLPRWFYRGALELLERLEASDIAVSRTFVGELNAVEDSESITALAGLGAKGWRAFPTGKPDAAIELTPFAEPIRLLGNMKRSGLGYDSGGYGIAGAAEVIVVQRRVVNWLSPLLLS
jgi:hypothetical protein